MKRKFSRAAWLIAPVLLTVSVVGLGQPAAGDDGRHTNGAPDTYVAAWDAVGVQAFSAAGLSPAEGHTIFAYLGVAVYDAVMAVEGGYEPFAVDLDAPDGASTQAAVATAARRILVHYLPAQAATIIEPAYGHRWPPSPTAKPRPTASQPVTPSPGDGSTCDPMTASAPRSPTRRRTHPSRGVAADSTHAADRSVPQADGSVQPALRRPVPTGRAATPRQPAVGRRLNEVKEIGSATSTTRTGEQTLAARFWGEAPVQQARGSFRRFVVDHQLDIVDTARFNAMWSVTYADALIACFDAKYTYTFWRPITAIRAGDTEATTPPSPTPHGHRCWARRTIPSTRARTRASPRPADVSSPGSSARHRIDFTVPSLTGLGDRQFANVADLEHEVGNARIWGGIHFRSAVDDGVKIGQHVSNWVLAHHFHRSHD